MTPAETRAFIRGILWARLRMARDMAAMKRRALDNELKLDDLNDALEELRFDADLEREDIAH